MTDAEDRGWGKGWPTSRVSDMTVLRIDGADFPAGVHRDIEPLMSLLLQESIRRDYIRLRDNWCWGYANRAIKNPPSRQPPIFTTTASNHSWGLAIDVNAPVNCFGCQTHTIPLEMGELWRRFGFQWGGFYSSTKDWMHFEFVQTPEDAAMYTARAQEEFMQDERLDEFAKGYDAYRDKFKKAGGVDPGEPPPERPAWFKKGWSMARFGATNPHGE